MTDTDLTPGEVELLIDASRDDVSLDWALIHLGTFGNSVERKPSRDELDAAFDSLRRLVDRSLISVGHLRFLDGSQVRPPPVEFVPEDLAVVRARVDEQVAAAHRDKDWAFSCWIVGTPRGDELARAAYEGRR